MEAVIFVGIQATGKSTFYHQTFSRTHIRINLDMLKTRHREEILLRACLDARQPFVVDNCNPTVEDRARYISLARASKSRVVGYYFQSRLQDAVARNEARAPDQRIPAQGMRTMFGRLQPPSFEEGFDTLYNVAIAEDGGFATQEWERDA